MGDGESARRHHPARSPAPIVARIRAGEDPVPEPMTVKLTEGPTVGNLAGSILRSTSWCAASRKPYPCNGCSSRVPVLAQALSQYENGRTRLRSEVLDILADALTTTVAQLSRAPEREWLGSVEFVQPRSSKRKFLRKVQESLAALTERSLTLEQKLGGGFPSPSLPVMEEIMLIHDIEDAESLAQNVRRRWGRVQDRCPSWFRCSKRAGFGCSKPSMRRILLNSEHGPRLSGCRVGHGRSSRSYL